MTVRTYVSDRDRLFRRRGAKVGITKYTFLSIKVERHPPRGYLVGVCSNSVRTPTPQALFGEFRSFSQHVPYFHNFIRIAQFSHFYQKPSEQYESHRYCFLAQTAKSLLYSYEQLPRLAMELSFTEHLYEEKKPETGGLEPAYKTPSHSRALLLFELNS